VEVPTSLLSFASLISVLDMSYRLLRYLRIGDNLTGVQLLSEVLSFDQSYHTEITEEVKKRHKKPSEWKV
jgi:hypothetical protein